MQMTTTRLGATTIAALDGRLDAVTAAEVEKALLGLVGAGPVVADLNCVGYVSSAGLRLLLKAAKLAKTTGTKFAVCMSQPAVREVFEISGFDKIIPTFASRDAALGSLG